VIENDSGVILGQGLAYDRCQIGVISNIDDGDHLGDFDIQEVSQLFSVFRTQIDVVLPSGYAVLNARDARVVEMAKLCDGAVLFFGMDACLPAIAAHLAQDQRAVFIRAGRIVLAQGQREEALTDITAVPLTYGGRVTFQIENILAAVATAWALNIPVEIIRAGIEAFSIDPSEAPWPFTVFESDHHTVVVDQAHNVSALRPVLEAITHFPAQARRAMYAAGADRRDEDLLAQGRLLGQAFDYVTLYDDPSVSSKRPTGQARARLRQGLLQGGRVQHIYDEPNPEQAVQGVLHALRAGELALLQSNEAHAGPTIDQVRRWFGQP
jgi:cyanophycin synthetase